MSVKSKSSSSSVVVGGVVKKFVLVAWQDSDVADQIKDRSFAGRLATNNKENGEEVGGELLKPKKRRVSKRPSIVAASANELKLDQLTVSDEPQQQQWTTKQANGAGGLGAHFVFGSQSGVEGGLMSSKTSNNKLEQSHRISYYEMCQVLDKFRNGLADQAVESMNKLYESQYFPEWFRLMRSVIAKKRFFVIILVEISKYSILKLRI